MNRANPISNIMAASMMMDYLGEKEAAAKIEKAITDVLTEGKVLTADLGGTATTSQIADAIAAKARLS
jgi:isocitrate/isopropylmalate dehydrogenase